MLNQANDVVSPVLNIIQNEIGNGTFENIINCSFLSTDTATIVTTFQPFGSSLILISALLTALGICNWIAVFFGFIYLQRKLTSADFKSGKHTKLNPEK